MPASFGAERSIPISDIKDRLITEGYVFDLSPEHLDDRLLASCNKIQRKRIEKAWATRKKELRLERLYKFPDNINHAHLLFSHDRQRILHSFKWILENLPGDAQSIADVGCATGTLSRLIVHYYPQSSVLGVDRGCKPDRRSKEGVAHRKRSARGFGYDGTEQIWHLRYDRLSLRH